MFVRISDLKSVANLCIFERSAEEKDDKGLRLDMKYLKIGMRGKETK